MSKRHYKINNLYLCSPLNFAKIMHKSFQNYVYKTEQGLLQTSGVSRIHRFAKDYELDGSRFCMLMITQDPDEKKAEKFFDKALKDHKKNNKFKALVGGVNLMPSDTEITYGE